jgi:hypothetical protein
MKDCTQSSVQSYAQSSHQSAIDSGPAQLSERPALAVRVRQDLVHRVDLHHPPAPRLHPRPRFGHRPAKGGIRAFVRRASDIRARKTGYDFRIVQPNRLAPGLVRMRRIPARKIVRPS